MQKDLAIKLKSYGDNYQYKYAAIKDYLTQVNCTEIYAIIDELTETLDFVEIGEIETEHKDKYLNEYLPQIMNSILSKQPYVGTYHTFLRKTNIFISCWLSRRIKNLNKMIPGDAQLLLSIFSPTNKYYDVSYLRGYQFNYVQDLREDLNNSQISIGTENDLWPWSLVEKNVTETYLPKHFAFNVYCFAKLGGFDVCKDLIQGDIKVENISFICKIYKAVTKMIYCLTNEQFERVIMPIIVLGLELSNKIICNNESKLEKSHDLCKFVKRIHKMIKISPHELPDTLLYKAADLLLILTMKLMRSSALEDRLRGLKEIIKQIKRVKSEGSQKDIAANSQLKAEALEKHDIFQHIFAESSIHREILKRCAEDDIFGFLYAWKKLSMENVLIMWNTAINKCGDPELQSCIFQVLCKLVVHFSSVHAKEIFTLISQIRYGDLNENIISLLVALTKNECLRHSRPIEKEETKNKNNTSSSSLKNSKGIDSEGNNGDFNHKKKNTSLQKEQDPFIVEDPPGLVSEAFGTTLHYLFSLIQDRCLSEGMKPDIQSIVIEQFLNIVVTYNTRISGEDIILKYLTICEEMMVKDESPFQIAKIYTPLLSHSPKSRIGIPDLLLKLIMILLKFKLEALNVISKSSSTNDVLEAPIQGSIRKLSYYEEISRRLSLMADLICSGAQKLTPLGMQSLCKILMHNNVSIKEKELFIAFMQRLTSSAIANQLILSGVFDFFLNEILFRLDPIEYTLNAFLCLKNILILLNSHFKRLSNENNCLIVNNFNLIGTQAVWQIYLISTYEKVKECAKDYLLTIYENLSGDLLEKEGNSIRKLFINECMKYIGESMENIRKGNKILQSNVIIGRAVQLLFNYIYDFEDELEKPEQKSRNINGMMDIYLYYKSANSKSTRNVSVNPNKSLTELLALLKQELFWTEKNKDILYLFNGEAILPSAITVEEIGFKQGAYIFSEPLINFNENAPSGNQKGCIETNSVHQLKAIIPGKKQEVYYKALTQSFGEVSQAIQLLMDDKALANIENEVDKVKKKRLAQAYKAKAENASSILLNNENYFNLLFACMTIDSEGLPQIIWNLLYYIPTSAFKRNEMMRLICSNSVSINWTEILQALSPFTLSYSLKVFIEILDASYSDQNKPEEYSKRNRQDQAAACLTRFIKDKGLTLLQNLLILLKNYDISQIKYYPVYVSLCYITGILNECIISAIMEIDRNRDLADLKNRQHEDEPDLHFEISTSVAKDIREFIKQQDLIPLLQFYIIVRYKDNNTSYRLESNCFSLMTALLHFNPQLYLTDFYDDPQFFEFLITTFLHSPRDQKIIIADDCLKRMFTMYNHSQPKQDLQIPPDIFFFNYMLTFLPNPNVDHPNSYYYFLILIRLADLYKSKKKDSSSIEIHDSQSLCSELMLLITQRLENKELPVIQNDTQLLGYLNLLKKVILNNDGIISAIIRIEEETKIDLVNLLCDNIFGFTMCAKANDNEKRRRKCSTDSELENALLLLYEMAKRSDIYYKKMLNRMTEFNNKQMATDFIEPIDRTKIEINKIPYVGLKNLGATCYINALLQQFYMMPDFRARILSFQQDEISKFSPDAIVVKLQELFANLGIVQQSSFNPENFFKGLIWNKRPIDVREQHDADEFFNIVTDKLEEELKEIGKGKLIRDMMQVTVANLIKSLESGFEYEGASEDFSLKLSLDIKGKNRIEDALEDLIKESVFDNDNKYYCETHKKKIRASSKLLIKTLSPTLVIHLKRFEFNYGTMRKQKLNDFCSFPLSLNLSKWSQSSSTNEKIIPENFDYELVGVIVHSGTAEGGHYVSLIKERDKKSKNLNKWFKFDDSYISEFNLADMQKLCFGGQKTNQNDNAADCMELDADTSAYLLFYQKINVQYSKELALLLEQDHRNYMSQECFKKMQENNDIHINFSIYCGNHYYDHILKCLDNSSIIKVDNFDPQNAGVPIESTSNPTDINFMLFQLGMNYAFDFVSKTKEAYKFTELEKILSKYLKCNANYSLWFLKLMLKDTNLLFENLFVNKVLDVRESMCAMLEFALTKILKTEEKFTSANEKDKAIYMKFIKVLVYAGLDKARYNYRKFDQYFQLLARITGIGAKEAITLIQLGLIGKLIDFLANTNISLLDERKSYPMMDKRFTDFGEPLHLLSQLIFSVSGKEMEKVTLPNEEIKLLFSNKWDFLSLIEYKYKCASKLYCHLSINNPERINILIPALIKEIYERNPQYSSHLFVLKDLISVKDNFIKRRWELAFVETEVGSAKNILEYIRNYGSHHEDIKIDILYLIAELLQINEIVEVIKENHLPKFEWTIDYLNKCLSEDIFMLMPRTDTRKKLEFILKKFVDILGMQKEKIKIVNEVTEIKKEKNEMQDDNATEQGKILVKNPTIADSEKMSKAESNGFKEIPSSDVESVDLDETEKVSSEKKIEEAKEKVEEQAKPLSKVFEEETKQDIQNEKPNKIAVELKIPEVKPCAEQNNLQGPTQ